mgnify:CR=1 FL=1
MNYYAVHKGHATGIYNTWDECRKQTDNFNGAKFRKFSIKSDAEYCKQLIDFLIDVKVNYGDSFDMPTTVKYLKQDIMENYVR